VAADTTGIGIIGCGTIAPAYLRTLAKAPSARVIALADLDVGRARARADEFGVSVATTPDELLKRDDVGLVIDLTVPSAHHDVNRRALEAGKHVYSEKPLAASAQEARALLELAERVERQLGCAPDTFLGVGYQTARTVLDDGAIGRPIAAVAHMVTRGPERWHHDPAFFYQPGAGPLLDMGPYYVTAMVALFGPVASVSAEGGRAWPERVVETGPRAGERVTVAVDTHVTLLLRFHSGALCTLLTSFDVGVSDLPRFEVFGEDGSLSLPDPNTFGGDVRVRRSMDEPWHTVAPVPGFAGNARGLGALDLLLADRDARPARASGALASHVLDVLDGGLTSMREGKRVMIDSHVPRPDPLTHDDLDACGWRSEVAS
jgi:predicted dehydrogenase